MAAARLLTAKLADLNKQYNSPDLQLFLQQTKVEKDSSDLCLNSQHKITTGSQNII
jgi:hypothetical protein